MSWMVVFVRFDRYLEDNVEVALGRCILCDFEQHRSLGKMEKVEHRPGSFECQSPT